MNREGLIEKKPLPLPLPPQLLLFVLLLTSSAYVIYDGNISMTPVCLLYIDNNY